MIENDIQKAMDSAFRLLAYRARSARELQQRLAQKGHNPEVIEHVIADLQEKGYQSDEDFARQFVQEKWVGSGWGPGRVQQELRRKGISNDLVDQLVEEVYGQIDLVETVLPLVEKRWAALQELPENTRRRRLTGYLQRRGYEWETIGKIMSMLGRSIER